MSEPSTEPNMPPNRPLAHHSRVGRVLLLYSFRTLQEATALQRLSVSGNSEDDSWYRTDEDESSNSIILSSPPTSAGVITPPESLAGSEFNYVKDNATDSDGPTFTYHRADSHRDFTVGASQFPLTPTSTLLGRDTVRRGDMAYHMLVTIGCGNFKLFFDTGSSTTWVRYANYHWLEGDQDPTTDLHYVNRPENSRRRQVYAGKPLKPVSGTIMRQQARLLSYEDGCKAMIYQYPLTDQTALPHNTRLVQYVNHPDGKQRVQEHLEFHYQYALAVGVNEKLEQDPTDGLIGLSPSNYQGLTYHTLRVPSFLDTISNVIPAAPNPSIGSATVMYIGLRYLPLGTAQEKKPEYQCFTSLGGWPCVVVPPFSNDIPVVRTPWSGWPDPLGGVAYRRWEIPLVRMMIRSEEWRDEGKRRTRVHVTEVPLFREGEELSVPAPAVKKGSSIANFLNIGKTQEVLKGKAPGVFKGKAPGASKGKSPAVATRVTSMPIHLDTGSSVSFVPLIALSAIAAHFGTAVELVSPSNGNPPAYQFPVPSQHVHGNPMLDRTYVVLHFLGRDSSIVEVKVPALYFLYAPKPHQPGEYECLIFADTGTEEAHQRRGTFGVNFFHVAWVALVKPDEDVPYVLIAPQLSTEVERLRYQLLPLRQPVRLHH